MAVNFLIMPAEVSVPPRSSIISHDHMGQKWSLTANVALKTRRYWSSSSLSGRSRIRRRKSSSDCLSSGGWPTKRSVEWFTRYSENTSSSMRVKSSSPRSTPLEGRFSNRLLSAVEIGAQVQNDGTRDRAASGCPFLLLRALLLHSFQFVIHPVAEAEVDVLEFIFLAA